MDDDQQFCLRWNNHQSTLISVFDTLLENETLVDCTLAAEGKFLKAHKVVLSACSPYFATLLSEQYDKHPIFILKDVKYQELRAMMDYMYRGEVNISQDQLAALLKAAESLQIKGLSDNRTGSGNSSSGLGGGGGSQQQQQKISAEQQHKHISVPGKLMTGSASAGYTLEQTKRSRIGPSSIDSQDLSGSREGSSSPTSRRRKKIRRRSIENVLADNHDNSNSSQVIQAGTSSIVPTTNATGAITAMLPMIGSGVGGTTTTISSTVASTITVAAQQQLQQQQQQQLASAATAAANIITANVTKKTESVKMGGGNTDAMNAAVTAVENIQDENAADSIDEKEMLMKEKQNHKRPKHQHEGVVATSTGKDEIVIEPKSEYDDDGNDETVEDLTLDDEEMGLEDLDHNAGPSHGGEGSSQGYAQWQVDRSQDEVFMAAQEAQQRDPQDKFRRNRKTSPPAKAQPATSSNEAAASSSTSAATKFTIQQKIPTGTAPKKGPYSVKRTVDPNEVFIKRRIGEGAKPLFSRDELRAKRSASLKHKRTSSSSSSSSRSSSPEVRRNSTKETSKSQPSKQKSPEKVPYFLDQKRENDRIKRVYGSRRSRSLSRDRRRTTRNRSRTRSPPSYKRRYHSSYGERRTPSRERYRSRYHRTDFSRSRSRSRERRRRNSYRNRNGLMDERSLQPATQFIPVPVPVEYPFMPPAWGPPMMPPQARFPFMMRPPIPAQVPFMPRHFHPPRYYMPNGFQRGQFRPRY